MRKIDMESTIHDFERTKVVRDEETGEKKFSIYKCRKCGLKGKRYPQTTTLLVSSEHDLQHVSTCIQNLNEDTYVGQQIIITDTLDLEDRSIRPGSIHTIISPSLMFVNGNGGVWILWREKKVKILFHQFEFHHEHKRSRRTT